METVTDDEFVNEWKVIGLTQRSDRRRWLNHGDIMEACAEKFTNLVYKTVCIEIDVGSREFRNRPDLHIAAHSRLSALIGVHGAQLAEAAFLPPGSMVMEFLPFVPDGMIFGEWTRFVDEPTPLGKIFSNTDLNHIGLPLAISSAMHIPCVVDAKNQTIHNKTKLYDCLDLQQNPWDDRHFTAPIDKVLEAIEKFVVGSKEKRTNFVGGNQDQKTKNKRPEGELLPTVVSASAAKHRQLPPTVPSQSIYCDHFQNLAGDDFVLYNVNCAPVADDDSKAAMVVTPHHYYRTAEWLEAKTHASMNDASILWSR